MPVVLIVDDDPDIRGMLSFLLGDCGFEVREARDGASALAALAEEPPDCMVLDLMMPGIDGFGVLERMRDQRLAPGVRVLILSCKSDEGSLVRSWELGADAYFSKPVDPYLLAEKLHSLLGDPERAQPPGSRRTRPRRAPSHRSIA